MLPIYEDYQDSLEIFRRKSKHISPHIHKSIEFVYVTEGTLELGIRRELYHMEKGDFAIIFPEIIHHFQVFDTGKCNAIHIMVSPSLAGHFSQELQQYLPVNPVIKSKKLHPDVEYAITALRKKNKGYDLHALHLAYVQIILARCLPLYKFEEKMLGTGNDIVFRTIAYIGEHFREPISLTSMAKDLGYSQFSLSRVFSKTFHRNFNQYLNETRAEYASALLMYTDQSIIDVSENSGFESQRTFNRVFKERYRMSPREYRNQYKVENEQEN